MTKKSLYRSSEDVVLFLSVLYLELFKSRDADIYLMHGKFKYVMILWVLMFGPPQFVFKFSFPISISDTSDFPINIFLLHGHAA